MKKIKALLVVVCTGVLLTACGNPSQKGVEYLEDGKYDQAIEQFEQAVDKKKNVGDAYRGIGIAKWEKKDYKGARKAFKKHPRRLIISLPTSYDGTRFSLVMDLAALSEQYKGTQVIFLRDSSDARFATPAAVRIGINEEKALFGLIRTTSLLKLAGLTKPLTHRRLFFPCPRIGSEKVTRMSTYRTTRALLFN